MALKTIYNTDDRVLTLLVNPDIFVENIMAQAAETMNSPSNSWGDIFMDMLQIQGIDCLPPHRIALNTKTGEITARNTPGALEKFRQSVEELNQPQGRCHFASRVPVQQTILVTASFYKISSPDFEKLRLENVTVARRKRFDCWELKPRLLSKLKQNLKSNALEPFRSLRIETEYGVKGSLYGGKTNNYVEFDCLPVVRLNDQWVEMKLQAGTTGVFTENPAGDWPDFAGRTNCALFADEAVENGGGSVFRTQNSASSSRDNNLVILVEVGVKPGSK
jgi:hypothetical protein